MDIEIPKYDHAKGDHTEQAPCWIPTSYLDGRYARPLIVCMCGKRVGIGWHHVHADGTVRASFWHQRGNEKGQDPEGCEWHVFIKLKDYDRGEFLPEQN